MALTAQLSRVGITPTRIHTGATVKLEKVGEGGSITKLELETEADIPGIDGESRHNENNKVEFISWWSF